MTGVCSPCEGEVGSRSEEHAAEHGGCVRAPPWEWARGCSAPQTTALENHQVSLGCPSCDFGEVVNHRSRDRAQNRLRGGPWF